MQRMHHGSMTISAVLLAKTVVYKCWVLLILASSMPELVRLGWCKESCEGSHLRIEANLLQYISLTGTCSMTLLSITCLNCIVTMTNVTHAVPQQSSCSAIAFRHAVAVAG